jgi:hypothetical protein
METNCMDSAQVGEGPLNEPPSPKALQASRGFSPNCASFSRIVIPDTPSQRAAFV